MSDNTKLKISNGLIEDKYSVKSKFVNFFLLAMFTLFPLFYTDYYYNIRHDKYYFFLVVTAVLVLMIGAVAITNSDSQSGTKNKAESVPWYKKLSFTDYAFGAFILVCTVSTVFSQNPADAFLGLSGRNNGLLLMIFYAVVYFLITRFFVLKTMSLLPLQVVQLQYICLIFSTVFT